MKRALTLAAAAAVLLAGTATAVLTGSSEEKRDRGPQEVRNRPQDDPRRLTVSSHGTTVQATPGSYCDARSNLCVDFAYPLPKSDSVPVHPGGEVVMGAGVRADEFHVSLVDSSGNPIATVPATALDSGGRRFRVTLPDRPRRGTLQVFMKYRVGTSTGDASFEAAMSMHKHR